MFNGLNTFAKKRQFKYLQKIYLEKSYITPAIMDIFAAFTKVVSL